MNNPFKQLKDFIFMKIWNKTPSPIEKRIEQERSKLTEQINLLRLSNSELIKTSKDLRFGVMQDLIDDIARKK